MGKEKINRTYEYNLDCVRLLCRPCHTQLHIELNTKT